MRLFEENSAVEHAAHGFAVVREIQPDLQSRIERDDGDAIARCQIVDEALRLDEHAHESADARGLEVFLEDEDDEAPELRHPGRSVGATGCRTSDPDDRFDRNGFPTDLDLEIIGIEAHDRAPDVIDHANIHEHALHLHAL